MLPVKIAGMGTYLPEHTVLSTELDVKLGLPLGSVEKKSGLISRHFAQNNETTSYMGAMAARAAMLQANRSFTDIDVIVGACGAGEQPIPSTAALFQKQLGLETSGIPCFDINSTCLSFVTALEVLSYMIVGGRYQRALIVSSELPSVGLNWNDMETCTIFGDGAAACVLEKSDGTSGILACDMETHSIGSGYCRIEAGGTRMPPARPLEHQSQGLFYMDGRKVYKLATSLIKKTQEAVFKKGGLTLDDIDWVIPHQASALAMHHVQKRFNIPAEKFANIYATHGNQMAASIPTVMSTLIKKGLLTRGQRIYLLGTGAGLSATGLIMEY